MTGWVVIKLGGDVVSGEAMTVIARDLAELSREGRRIAVVHGGGNRATELQEKLGQVPKIVGGRRITDAATLEVMKMTIAGQMNVDLCSALIAAGAHPVGLHGASSCAVRAAKRPPRVVSGAGPDPIDFGLVGDVVGFNELLLTTLSDAGFIPVLACLGADEDGRVYNINADVVASRLAVVLRARDLLLVTGAPAVLRDINDPTSRIERLTADEGKQALSDGIITKGMIPKIEESFAAIREGVEQVHIVGQLRAGDIVSEMLKPGSVGTVLVK